MRQTHVGGEKVAFLCDPECSSLLIGSQMQKLRRPAEVRKHTDLSGPGNFRHVEGQRTVCRMAAHDDDKDHAIGGEITLVQREECWCCLSCVGAGWFLLHKAAHAV